MYRIIPTERFNADVKYYVKKKRYVHIGEDIKKVTDELQNGNFIGNEIPGLKIESDGHTYKVTTMADFILSVETKVLSNT